MTETTIVTLLGIVGATFVSEDLTAIGVGLAIRDGVLPLWPGLVACFLGIYVGDLGLWMLGRFGGRRVLAWRWLSDVPAASLQRLGAWIDRRPAAAVIGSRFLPGTRLPLYLAAGACGTRPWAFAGWTGVAVALWTPCIVLSTMAAGPTLAAPLERWLGRTWLTKLLTALIVFAVVHTAVGLATRRGRQRLAARIGRATHWEFWPAWALHAPIAVGFAWLALRHRGLSVFTAANPGLEDGGVVGESKGAILARLPQACVLPWAVVPPGALEERLTAARAVVAAQGWLHPFVAKPDVGERGVGVRWIHDDAQLRRYLEAETGAVLLQMAHDGPFEAGLFYVRHPGDERGRLFSITDKQFPTLVGDGGSSIEDLIWSHPRLRLQARTFLTRLGERTALVPAAGEQVGLGCAGNHAQGTRFLDGAHLSTPALEAAVDTLAREIEGFHFGRFDVRYRCREDLRAGRGFAIVELNGVTSEATHIYDPSHSILYAWRTLMAQWSLAFAIGASNRTRGHRPIGAVRLVRLVAAYLRRRPPHRVAD